MYRNIFIIILLAASFLIAQNQEEIIRDFVVNGQIDASIDMNSNENSLHLVQIDAINDSLLLLVEEAVPDLDLFAGPSSYHRIITENQYERLLSTITDDYLLLINDDYQIPDSRDYWVHTIYGSNYYGSSGEVGNTCYCLDASNCVVVGFNDSWYDPFDYYGEAWWNFEEPSYDEITEVRVYVQGAQCDALPVWSETDVSIRDNNCSWNSNFQATLSMDYTLNGPYVIPADQLSQIWCDDNLQPVVGSEDNYTVDFVRMEVFYSCNTPAGVSDLVASSNQYCDHVQLNWTTDTSDQYNIYRDGELFMQLTNEINQYSDYQAQPGVTHEYCIESINGCGSSEFICSYGSRKNVPEAVEFISASDGEFQDFIQIQWELINEENIVYKLYRDGIQLSVIGGNQDPVYIDQFVEQSIIYEYCIEAENDCGNSEWICDEGFLGIGQSGDINLDDTIDVLDVVLLLNFILELQVATDDQIWLSDINQDEVLNILDIVALVSIILD